MLNSTSDVNYSPLFCDWIFENYAFLKILLSTENSKILPLWKFHVFLTYSWETWQKFNSSTIGPLLKYLKAAILILLHLFSWLKVHNFFNCVSRNVVLRNPAFPLWRSWVFFIIKTECKKLSGIWTVEKKQNYQLCSLRYSVFMDEMYGWIYSFIKSKYNNDLWWVCH